MRSVVVQGPPGTGKTLTIANIVGHWMAQGRRILIAAHTAEALTAIRDKLPPALRNLVTAVTASDREGTRQLEEAVSALASRLKSLNPRETKQRVDELLGTIARTDDRLAAIDAALAAVARDNLSEIDWRGSRALPQAIAAWTAAQGERHAWFPDRLDLTPPYEPRFGETGITAARSLRRRLGDDLCYQADHLPTASAELPGLGVVVAAHRAFLDAQVREAKERDGHLPRPDLSTAGEGDLADLLAWLERLAGWRESCQYHHWMPVVWETLASGQPAGRLAAEAVQPLLHEAVRLAKQGEALALHALELAEIAEADRLADALANLAAGRKPFGFFNGFGRNPVKDALDTARVAAEPPRDAAAWAVLAELHAWRRTARSFAARWNAFAAQHGLTRLPDDQAAMPDALGRLGRPAGDMLALVVQAPSALARLRVLFPYGLEVEAVVLRIDVAVAVAALRANLGDADVAAAIKLRETLARTGKRVGGSLGEALLQMADGLGTSGVTEAEAATRWRDIQAEADRLARLRGDLQRLAALAGLVSASGAGVWATRFVQEPTDAEDAVLPADWRDAWDHARARGFLARVADRAAVQALADERAELTATREMRFLEAIELRTYLGLHRRLTEGVQAALRKFMAALARLPKTQGAKTAVRQRRILRDSLQRAVQAIPCWIMPEWRIAEQLPPEIGGFDLVIIDEASQSNIMALPAVLRGRKLLIVGDDRQVRPVAVGIEDAAITRLRTTYLQGQPLAEQIDPATSLYELGGMMYPGKVVVLREHFRCVEPIIRFSSRFYAGGLVPLRLPKPSERLDPPLIDILVEDGRRRGDVNEAEAEIVVQEIRRAIAEPALHAAGKRSIGVISLHSWKQAKLIYDRLIQAIGPEAMSDHRIMCGDAATFQGQERDIMFLSMVHDPGTASKQSSRLYEQRYNVALSRARDRMVLVRSVTPSALKEGDIKLEVLRHFQDPLAAGRVGPSADPLAACESGFERDVGARLLHAGYRLRAQVPAGGYRLDFVVEGAGDRRLAVELDGDSFHGPDRWAQDVRRQKALERVGWNFWRCWASEWEADKPAVFRALVRTLERHGIEPFGAAAAGGAPSVEFRSVRYRAAAMPAAPAADLFGDMSPETEPAERAADRKVSEGDQVVVRYADGKARSRTVQIVADGSADGIARIAAASPLAVAILGCRVEEEAAVEIDGTSRTVVVEQILELT